MIVHIIDKEVFQEVLLIGAKTRTEHFTLHRINVPQDSLANPKLESLQIGVVVPKRLAKRAVTRNAIKRQAYSISRESANRYLNEQHVIRLNKEFDKKKYLSASSKLLKSEVNKEIRALYNLVD